LAEHLAGHPLQLPASATKTQQEANNIRNSNNSSSNKQQNSNNSSSGKQQQQYGPSPHRTPGESVQCRPPAARRKALSPARQAFRTATLTCRPQSSSPTTARSSDLYAPTANARGQTSGLQLNRKTLVRRSPSIRRGHLRIPATHKLESSNLPHSCALSSTQPEKTHRLQESTHLRKTLFLEGVKQRVSRARPAATLSVHGYNVDLENRVGRDGSQPRFGFIGAPSYTAGPPTAPSRTTTAMAANADEDASHMSGSCVLSARRRQEGFTHSQKHGQSRSMRRPP